MPELFSSPEIVERRVRRFVRRLNLDYDRAVRWGFAQAVLSAIWSVEDGFILDEHAHGCGVMAMIVISRFVGP